MRDKREERDSVCVWVRERVSVRVCGRVGVGWLFQAFWPCGLEIYHSAIVVGGVWGPKGKKRGRSGCTRLHQEVRGERLLVSTRVGT